MSRSKTTKIIGVLFIINSCWWFGGLILNYSDLLLIPNGPWTPSEWAHGHMFGTPAIPMITGLLLLFSAIGILKLKKWGRYLALIYLYFSISSHILSLASLAACGTIIKDCSASKDVRIITYFIIWIIILILVTIYFNKTEIKNEFN